MPVGFNEAGGFLPRKLLGRRQPDQPQERASMRPEDFSPGNLDAGGYQTLDVERASMRPEDFSPGNPAPRPAPARSASRFNEAGGFLPRKLGGWCGEHDRRVRRGFK